MRQRLGTLAALAALAAAAPTLVAGCAGDRSTTEAVAPAPSASSAGEFPPLPTADPSASPPAPTAEPPAGVAVVGLHTASAAGGRAGRPVRLRGADDVAALGLEGRRGGRLGATLRAAWRDWRATRPGEERALLATVVAVGCTRPVDVVVGLDPLVVEPVPRPGSGGVQCLVPETTVALVEVPVTALTP